MSASVADAACPMIGRSKRAWGGTVAIRGLRYVRNNALGALALFVALGGTGYAATGGFTSNGKLQACASSNGTLKLLKGKKCKKGQKAVIWNQQGVAGPQGPTGATGPSGIAGLNGAAVPNATNAATAATANNALALGGIPPSGYTQRGCDTDTGQVRGFAHIPAKISGEMSPVDTAYNCSGGAVEARKIETGLYEFEFVDNPSEVALATAEAEGTTGVTANATQTSPGVWDVLVSRNGEVVNKGLTVVLF